MEAADIDQSLNHLFRQESGKMVAVLAKIFGTENLELAEDVVQDALLSALETWKFRGVPDNPKAWLYRTAKNKAIDIIRKRKHDQLIDFSTPESQLLTSAYTSDKAMDNFWEEEQVQDDFLAMMFACCHPDISQENQITFILKSLCGFSTKEVARAFLTAEDTISKRLYRTKEYFRKHKIRPEVPSGEKLFSQTKTVLDAIYLMFNEGYNATHVDEVIREDLIGQALALCKCLLSDQRTSLSETYALMSLMCFHTARVNSRMSSEGELILLDEQDRTAWDQDLIHYGNLYLNKSAFGVRVSHFHFEAAIAYQHCKAEDYERTNWKAILGYYDGLLALSFDPIVSLNRTIVILQLNGPQAALEAYEQLQSNKPLQRYPLYYTVSAEIHQQLGNTEAAINGYLEAFQISDSEKERSFLKKKMNALTSQSAD